MGLHDDAVARIVDQFLRGLAQGNLELFFNRRLTHAKRDRLFEKGARFAVVKALPLFS